MLAEAEYVEKEVRQENDRLHLQLILREIISSSLALSLPPHHPVTFLFALPFNLHSGLTLYLEKMIKF